MRLFGTIMLVLLAGPCWADEPDEPAECRVVEHLVQNQNSIATRQQGAGGQAARYSGAWGRVIDASRREQI